MNHILQVVTTLGSQSEAQSLGQALVEKRLAACAQVAGPLQSTYWWQGALETVTEWQVVFKTDRDHFEALAAALRKLHPYQTPELLAFEAVCVGAEYGQWLAAELAPRDQKN